MVLGSGDRGNILVQRWARLKPVERTLVFTCTEIAMGVVGAGKGHKSRWVLVTFLIKASR